MLSIYKRELDGYFNGFTGYLFVAVSLAVIGIYAMANNLTGGYANFEFALDSSKFVFTILIPILTMRTLAEDRKNKTDQLLYSAPVGAGAIVTGKFLAAATVFAVPCLVSCVYPVLLSNYGTVSYVTGFGGILAFFLMGCVMIALGIFMSALTESLIVAAVLSFGSLLVWLLMDGLVSFIPATAAASLGCWCALAILAALAVQALTRSKTLGLTIALGGGGLAAGLYFLRPELLEGSFNTALQDLSIFSRFSSLADGIYDLTTLVFYLSLTVLFLFFAGIAVEKRRWS